MGEAAKLIRHKPHAGAWIDDAGAPDVAGNADATTAARAARGPQAYAVLRARFEVPEPPKDHGKEGKINTGIKLWRDIGPVLRSAISCGCVLGFPRVHIVFEAEAYLR